MRTAEGLYIDGGLTVVRFAPEEGYGDIIDDLVDEFGDTPGVEIREFNPPEVPEDELSHDEPGIRLLRAREVRWQAWPRGRLLAPIVESIVEGVPDLEDPKTVNFADATVMETASGESFVVLEPDQDSYNDLSAERSSIIYGIEQGAHVPHQRWHRGHLDMTAAWVGPEAMPGTADQIADYLAGLLPLQIELEPAEFFPDPRQND